MRGAMGYTMDSWGSDWSWRATRQAVAKEQREIFADEVRQLRELVKAMQWQIDTLMLKIDGKERHFDTKPEDEKERHFDMKRKQVKER